MWTAWDTKQEVAGWMVTLVLESTSFSQRPSDAFGTVWGQIQLIPGVRGEPHHIPTQQTFIGTLCGFIYVLLKGLLLPGKNVCKDKKQGPGDLSSAVAENNEW